MINYTYVVDGKTADSGKTASLSNIPSIDDIVTINGLLYMVTSRFIYSADLNRAGEEDTVMVYCVTNPALEDDVDEEIDSLYAEQCLHLTGKNEDLHAQVSRLTLELTSRERDLKAAIAHNRMLEERVALLEGLCIGPFSYQQVPNGYICSQCGATGVKLWRNSQCCVSAVELLCGNCAIEYATSRGHKVSGPITCDGKVHDEDCGQCDQIGWMVPAVPTEDGDTYWGYTSVPHAGVCWWKGLPIVVEEKVT